MTPRGPVGEGFMVSVRRLGLAALVSWCPVSALAQGASAPVPAPAASMPAETPAPPGARLYFISPADGARIRGPFVVRFGLQNMGVTQAGNAAPNAGHHHLLIDVTEPLVPGEPIPAGKSHIHFGGGQTETQLDLAAGKHTLQLVLGDADHRPFKPVIASDTITITVVDSEQAPKRKRRRAAPRSSRPVSGSTY